jgi:hypothetical protein
MRILLVNRFFGDSHAPTGRMLGDVAAELRHSGHEVFVLTTRAKYAGGAVVAAPAAAGSIHIRAVRQWNGLPRLFNWLWFWLNAMFSVPFMRWERCVLLTDPPFLSLAAVLARFVHGAARRSYLWTMDLYPEALAASGRIPEGRMVYRLLRKLANLSLRAVDGVISLGPTQRRRLASYSAWRATERFVLVVPPWDHRPLERVPRQSNIVVKRFGWDDRKVALYAGNLGEGHTYEEFAAAARELAAHGRRDWVFAFFVRGSGVAPLRTATQGLPNVLIADYLAEADTAALLWSATVHLISMQPGWEGVIVPSKLYGVLKTQAPVLFVGPQDAETNLEIVRLRRGQQLAPGSSGATVARVLDQMSSEPPRPIYNEGAAPQEVAHFIVS